MWQLAGILLIMFMAILGEKTVEFCLIMQGDSTVKLNTILGVLVFSNRWAL